MAIVYSTGKQTTSAGFKLAITGIIGLAVGTFAGLTGPGRLAPLLGWETAAAIYLGWTWLTVVRLEDSLTGDYARREDPSRTLAVDSLQRHHSARKRWSVQPLMLVAAQTRCQEPREKRSSRRQH